jgi:tRNA-dihydrouridine synthase A
MDRRLSVAPMMDCTDRHDRYLLRLISRHVLLYSEMVTTGALLHGDRSRFLAFDPVEHPVALQLGGSDSGDLATCARLAVEWGYDEINLNVGCPSERVQSGNFGASLMLDPDLVAECVGSMQAAADIPVTVKTRIGVDDRDTYEHLRTFVEAVAAVGCATFVIHARKAFLSGLSPRQNRSVPPLNYDTVYRLKEDFPGLEIIINGGITDLDQVADHLARVDGVMIGREAYANPYLLAKVDSRFFEDSSRIPDRGELLEQYIIYCERQLCDGVSLYHLARHVIGLFHGEPRSRLWRRYISDNAHRKGAGVEVLHEAVEIMEAVPAA